MKLITGGGSLAQVAAAVWLFLLHKDFKSQNKRLDRIERFLWPDVFGLVRKGDHDEA